MNIGVVLAAGKGKRFNSKNSNKTTFDFFGKPLVKYATDLFLRVCDRVVVVVGVYPDEVIKSVGKNPDLSFVIQKKRMGTGHAVKVALKQIVENGWMPEKVWVGYGDHMMFYTSEIILRLSSELDENNGVLSMITSDYEDPDSLAWGRVIRKKNGDVLKVIEQKDASEEERKIKEQNAGLYCFRWDFLINAITKMRKSSVTKEYYITDLINIAVEGNVRVVPVKVPFKYVGIGVNTKEELIKSRKLYKLRSETLKRM